MQNKVQQFIEKYNLFKEDKIQQIQLQHRFALVEAFQIKPGMRVLEIGCGQGDTTVALADAVGAQGHVIALDIASGDYGAPFTLAEAHDRILASPLGERITFHLETDFLQFDLAEPVDVIVLSHCSWYFQSAEQLQAYFEKMQKLAKRICFAEWDMRFTHISQRSHFCAVSILALYSAFVQNDGNIQHVFSCEQIKDFANSVQLQVVKEAIVEASFLQDGAWEKDYANSIASQFTAAPGTIQALVKNYYEVMNSVEEEASLNSFVLIFERSL